MNLPVLSQLEAPVWHIHGAVMVGPDEVLGELWVVDGLVTYERPPESAQVRTLNGWVLPGLVDAHCHLGMGADGAVNAEETLRQALTNRDAGTLLIRDAGSAADTRWLAERADVPRVIRAGRHVARSRRYLRNFGVEIEPPDLVAQVQQQADRGDGWVKIVGDWIDRDLGDLAPCWPRETLTLAVAAAHAVGARVTVHCFGEDGIADAIAAGVDGIEHAIGMEPEHISAVAKQGIAVVPTLLQVEQFPLYADRAAAKFPVYAAHMRRLHANAPRVITDAYDAGVPLFAGTDAGGTVGHGQLVAEVALLVAAGVPTASALDAACWGARSWLGRPALAEGDPADLLVLAADPRLQLEALAHPQVVMLGGQAVVRDGVSVAVGHR